MTPHDLALIGNSAATLEPEPFAELFYDTLFELAPTARDLFPHDLADQRRKLMTELTSMVALATSSVAGELDRFVERVHRLGARHVAYGATSSHYDIVGTALVSALSQSVPDWDTDHETAWTRLYGLVATTMLDGARLTGRADSAPTDEIT
jgi:nitric oxide dioxygenase